MAQRKLVRAICHDGTLQLLDPVDLPAGAELEIAVPVHSDTEAAVAGPVYPTRPQSPETLRRLCGLITVGGNALVDSEAVELARALHQLPPSLVVYGIEGKTFAVSTGLSPAVETQVQDVMEQKQQELCGGTFPEDFCSADS